MRLCPWSFEKTVVALKGIKAKCLSCHVRCVPSLFEARRSQHRDMGHMTTVEHRVNIIAKSRKAVQMSSVAYKIFIRRTERNREGHHPNTTVVGIRIVREAKHRKHSHDLELILDQLPPPCEFDTFCKRADPCINGIALPFILLAQSP